MSNCLYMLTYTFKKLKKPILFYEQEERIERKIYIIWDSTLKTHINSNDMGKLWLEVT